MVVSATAKLPSLSPQGPEEPSDLHAASSLGFGLTGYMGLGHKKSAASYIVNRRSSLPLSLSLSLWALLLKMAIHFRAEASSPTRVPSDVWPLRRFRALWVKGSLGLGGFGGEFRLQSRRISTELGVLSFGLEVRGVGFRSVEQLSCPSGLYSCGKILALTTRRRCLHMEFHDGLSEAQIQP